MRGHWLRLLLAVLLICGCESGTQDFNATVPNGSQRQTFSNSLGLTRVDLEENVSVQNTVGAPGGNLTAVGNDGTRYALSIPAGALLTNTTIRMIPVRQVQGLGVVEGVHLTPEGQQFFSPVTLTIETSSPGRLFGYAYRGNAENPSLYPMEVLGNGRYRFHITHFSGYGGTLEELPASDLQPGEQAAWIMMGRIQDALFPTADASPGQAALQSGAEELAGVIRLWYEDVLRGLLQGFTDPSSLGDDETFTPVLDQYASWRAFAEGKVGRPELASQVAARLVNLVEVSRVHAAAALRVQIERQAALARQNGDIQLVELVLKWFAYAEKLGLATAEFQLDLPRVLSLLDVQLVFDNVQFPDSLGANQSAPLSFRVGYQIGENPVMFNRPMVVTLNVENGTFDGDPSFLPSGATYNASVTRESAAQDLEITIDAQFVDFGYITGRHTIVLQGQSDTPPVPNIAGGWSGSYGPYIIRFNNNPPSVGGSGTASLTVQQSGKLLAGSVLTFTNASNNTFMTLNAFAGAIGEDRSIILAGFTQFDGNQTFRGMLSQDGKTITGTYEDRPPTGAASSIVRSAVVTVTLAP